MTYFLPTKRHILMWKSNYNLKEHKSCGKKSKVIQQNKDTITNLNKKAKSGKVPHLLSLEDLDVFSSNTQTETSWVDVVYKSEIP